MEIINVNGVSYNAENVTTSLNSISFTVSDTTIDILKESFRELFEISRKIKVVEQKMNENPENSKLIDTYCELIDKFSRSLSTSMEAYM